MLNILDEAKWCLQCKKPKCREACPINNPIPEFIKLLIDGKIKEAGNLVFTNNPLTIVCSLVCPHSEYCQGHCIRGVRSTPVQIGQIEHYIAQYCLDNLDLFSTQEYSGNIGVIGGGAAGIALAFYLQRVGYQVTIYESQAKIGGIMRYGIPEFRLPKKILDRLEAKLRELGAIIQPHTTVGPTTTVDDMLRDGFDAVFMSTGVWKPVKLEIPGDSLGHVHYAINFLKLPEVYDLGDKVVVIGAGNVAMDCARTAIRQSVREVVVLYRKGESDMPCRRDEYEWAKMDGVIFSFYSTPTRITKEGVYYIDNSENGSGKEEFIETDTVIVAISQESQKNIVATSPEIELDEKGRVIVDEHMMTTKEGVFASGDVVTGAKTVNLAVSQAKHAANTIHNYVQSKKNPQWEEELLYSYDIMETKEEDQIRFTRE
ncbi:MAG: NAD(P)-dependent oxidoreductase [Clostridiaceae bacterium]|nr:NAD(P)-dependent oxidoreductase [Clostridiaceae bacterium]